MLELVLRLEACRILCGHVKEIVEFKEGRKRREAESGKVRTGRLRVRLCFFCRISNKRSEIKENLISSRLKLRSLHSSNPAKDCAICL
jgi:hypothetical protein